jgi:predicted Zn-dependent protease
LLQQALHLSSADETEVLFSATREALTRFAHNVICHNVADVDAGLEIRAAFGSRVGRATTNDLSALGVERVVRQACDMARHLPENPQWPGLPEPVPLPDLAVSDSAVVGLCEAPQRRAQVVAEVCRAARSARLLASGAFSVETAETAVMNSRGLFAYAPNTQADLTLVVEKPEEGASAFAHATGWRLEQIDVEHLMTNAIERALAGRRPRRVPAAEYPVVLEPYAVMNLLEALAEDGMGALAVQEGRSWMNRRIGQRSLAPQVSIFDDAFDPDGLPQAFDCEGVPKQRVPIVVEGVPTSPVYDRVTAAREPGKVSTGHAQPFEEEWDGPLPENLSMAPGGASMDELIRTVERGLYVTRFWYVNLTSPHHGGVTGTTRDGVWWIERGELAYPVANMRFDQDLIPALRGVAGVGRERATLAGTYGVHRIPALSLESFRFIEVDGDA